MVNVKRYERQVANAGIPNLAYGAQANASAFGADRAENLGKIGATAANIASDLIKEDARAKKKENKNRVNDALIAAEKEVNAYVYGDGTEENRGAYGRQGRDAVGVVEDTAAKLKEIRDRHVEGFEDEELKSLFDSSYNRYGATIDKGMKQHRFNQAESARKNSLDARNSQMADNAVRARTRLDEQVKSSDGKRTISLGKKYVEDIRANVAAKYAGQDREVIKAAQDAQVHSYHMDIFKAHLSAKDNERAKEYLANEWDEIDPNVREELKAKLNEEVRVNAINDRASEIVAAGGSLEQQLKKVYSDPKFKDAKSQDELKKRVKERAKEVEEAKDVRATRHYESEFKKATKNFRTYEPPVFMESKRKEHLRRYVAWLRQNEKAKVDSRYATTTSPELKMELHETAARSIPALKELLEKSIPNISKADYDLFTKKVYDKTAASQTMASYVSKAIKGLGFSLEKANGYRTAFEYEHGLLPIKDQNTVFGFNKINDSLMMLDSDYWSPSETRFDHMYANEKGDKFIPRDDQKPRGLPSNAKWEIVEINGARHAGWSYKNKNGLDVFYSTSTTDEYKLKEK